jgi:murein DD-endopeptidase MepM/ murein hydrolase activator NlpD
VLAAAFALAAMPLHAQGIYDTLREGESLASFARRHGTDTAALRKANRLSANTTPRSGTRLYIPKPTAGPAATVSPKPKPAVEPPKAPSSGTSSSTTTYTVKPGDTLTGVARRHGLSVETLAASNGLAPTSNLAVGQKLKLPSKSKAVGASTSTPKPAPTTTTTPKDPDPPRASSGGEGGGTPSSLKPSRHGYIWPVEGRVLTRFTNTSSAKRFGIDIAAPYGTEVRASRDGRVIYASDVLPVYGRMVIVEHDSDIATCYAHLSSILVRKGERVSRGQPVGRIGDTGKTAEPALHFELRRNGDAVNPEDYLP